MKFNRRAKNHHRPKSTATFEKIIAFAVLLSLSPAFLSSSLAEIYEWTDEKGNAVYSDSPRSGARARERNSRLNWMGERRDDAHAALKKHGGEKRPYGDLSVTMYMTPW